MIIKIKVNNKALERLKDFSKEAKLHYEKMIEVNDIDTWGVRYNTYRGFAGWGSPSKTYKEWAVEVFSQIKPDLHGDRDRFDELHRQTVRSLGDHWLDRKGAPLRFSHKNKLTDLFFKHLSRHPGLDEESRNFIVHHGHIPLDKNALLEIRRLLPGLILSSKPAMGDISRPEDYDFLQCLVRTVMDKLGLPVLYFDFVAWDNRELTT